MRIPEDALEAAKEEVEVAREQLEVAKAATATNDEARLQVRLLPLHSLPTIGHGLRVHMQALKIQERLTAVRESCAREKAEAAAREAALCFTVEGLKAIVSSCCYA